MRIAFIGTRGVPARYGGFETAAEEIGARLVDRGHRVVVYCRGAEDTGKREHLGMDLVHLPALRSRTAETLSHTAASVLHQQVARADVAVVFNAANAPLLPALRLRRIPTAVHVDGLEWQRTKWSATGQRYYRLAEKLAVRWGDALIADARGIQDYYRDEHRARTWFIPYGAPDTSGVGGGRLGELDLAADGYHLVVARFEPENKVERIVEGYRRSAARLPLVVVGGAPYDSGYGDLVRATAGDDPRIRLVGPVWDQELLDQLYAGARTYLHGHSVGGTNPSLLRAVGGGAPTVAFDVSFNREVLLGNGVFFRDPQDVARAVEDAEADPAAAHERGRLAHADVLHRYHWDGVAADYERLCLALAEGTAATPPADLDVRPAGVVDLAAVRAQVPGPAAERTTVR
ncbi:DUF1972 domain-containing protein [Vallicoccus soli]|uniref:DUF1972 domain-containing protein n=1 Tax=Vallicoccus soli TaxID=2339232 RepID=A0A3A3Z4L2_9ACTN|nr:DUF1972 domain-containing protein [Vallicoccus soli]RJK97878.1 DUF1972 domain-containing protein [Vallicoccus soli]